MIWITAIALGLLTGLILAMLATPRIVEYAETIDIEAPVERVYDATRMQADLMRWSAWPSSTGSDCSVAGPDGMIGARTVFLGKDGRPFGYQEVTALTEQRRVAFSLTSKGPPQKPELTFHFVPLGPAQSRVLLHFRNELAPPFHVLLRLFGVVRWTRSLHLKDLEGLKRFCEPPFLTYAGTPAHAAA
jgi:uncharacterized protein YndB with AHSA1/START domain